MIHILSCIGSSLQAASFSKVDMEHQSTEAAGVWIFLSPSHPSLPLPPSRAPLYFAGSICSTFHIHSPSPASNHSILNQQCAEGKAVAADGQKRISFFNFFFFYLFLSPQLPNYKTQMCCQLEHTRIWDQPAAHPNAFAVISRASSL